MKLLEVLKEKKKIVIVDQHDLEKEYGFSWQDFGDFLDEVDKIKDPNKALISDGMVDGFEEAVWEYEIEGLKIKETTVYGIGSITEILLIE